MEIRFYRVKPGFFRRALRQSYDLARRDWLVSAAFTLALAVYLFLSPDRMGLADWLLVAAGFALARKLDTGEAIWRALLNNALLISLVSGTVSIVGALIMTPPPPVAGAAAPTLNALAYSGFGWSIANLLPVLVIYLGTMGFRAGVDRFSFRIYTAVAMTILDAFGIYFWLLVLAGVLVISTNLAVHFAGVPGDAWVLLFAPLLAAGHFLLLMMAYLFCREVVDGRSENGERVTAVPSDLLIPT